MPLLSPFSPGLTLEPPTFRPMQRLPFDHHGAKDAAALAKLAREHISGADFGPRTAPAATFIGFIDVRLDRFAAVLSAVSGPKCDLNARFENDGKRCTFPRTIIAAGAEE